MIETAEMMSRRDGHFYQWKQLWRVLGAIAIAYTLACLLLFLGQRYFLYRPKPELAMLPKV